MAINQHLLTAQGIYCVGLLADGTQSNHAGQQANSFPLALGIAAGQASNCFAAHSSPQNERRDAHRLLA